MPDPLIKLFRDVIIVCTLIYSLYTFYRHGVLEMILINIYVCIQTFFCFTRNNNTKRKIRENIGATTWYQTQRPMPIEIASSMESNEFRQFSLYDLW